MAHAWSAFVRFRHAFFGYQPSLVALSRAVRQHKRGVVFRHLANGKARGEHGLEIAVGDGIFRAARRVGLQPLTRGMRVVSKGRDACVETAIRTPQPPLCLGPTESIKRIIAGVTTRIRKQKPAFVQLTNTGATMSGMQAGRQTLQYRT